MKKYNVCTLLWIADLKVEELLIKRELENEIQTLNASCGLSNNHVDEVLLDGIRKCFYDLEEIQEELILARQKRAEYLKDNPTQDYISREGFICNYNPQVEEDD